VKIQLASDLHLEFIDRKASGEILRVIEPTPDVDVLVLAGDIHQGTQAIDRFRDWPVPVIYVAGNHEFYNQRWERARDDLRSACAGSNIHFLDNQDFEFNGVRFLGSTLWTDFRLAGLSQAEWMRNVDAGLNDFRAIRTIRGRFHSRNSLADHKLSRSWLECELSNDFDGETVVVTHHGPHPKSIHPRYAGNPLNAGFVSDLEPLMAHVDLWLHGHVHDNFDYQVGRCRVVANPRGYQIGERVENPMFQPDLVIELAREG